jgi:hypothetical protein
MTTSVVEKRAKMNDESFDEKIRKLTELRNENRITENEYKSLVALALNPETSNVKVRPVKPATAAPVELNVADRQLLNQERDSSRRIFSSVAVVAISLFLICAAWGALLPYTTQHPYSPGKLKCSAPIVEIFAKGDRNLQYGKLVPTGSSKTNPLTDKINNMKYQMNYCSGSAKEHLYVVALAALLCLIGMAIAMAFDNSRNRSQ